MAQRGDFSGATLRRHGNTKVYWSRRRKEGENARVMDRKGVRFFFFLSSLKTEHIDPQTETVHRDGSRIDSHIHRDCDTRDGAARHELGRGSWR